MNLLSVNVSQPRALNIDGRSYETGIYKQAVAGPVRLARLGLAGDGQADLKAHGGPHRAIYAYPQENYAYWADKLNRDDFQLANLAKI